MSDVEGTAEVVGALNIWVQGLRANVMKAAHEIGITLANYAKSHHKWGNPYSKGYTPTGQTDLTTEHDEALAGDIATIALSAGMDYDVFLELAHQGKWAWLWPAVVANEGKIKEILVKNLGGGAAGRVSETMAAPITADEMRHLGE